MLGDIIGALTVHKKVFGASIIRVKRMYFKVTSKDKLSNLVAVADRSFGNSSKNYVNI